MTVNPDLVGRSFPALPPYLVGREKVREFARAVFSEDPLSLDVEAARAAGYTDLVAPPTFAVILQQQGLEQLLAEPDAGIDFGRLVHGDQRFTYTRPIVAGDELIATLAVTSVKTLAGNAIVTAVVDVIDAEGAGVVTATSTMVIRAGE